MSTNAERDLIKTMVDDFGENINEDDFHEWFQSRAPGRYCVADEAMRLLSLFVVENNRRLEMTMLVEDDHRIRVLMDAVEADVRIRTIIEVATYLGVDPNDIEAPLINGDAPLIGLQIPRDAPSGLIADNEAERARWEREYATPRNT